MSRVEGFTVYCAFGSQKRWVYMMVSSKGMQLTNQTGLKSHSVVLNVLIISYWSNLNILTSVSLESETQFLLVHAGLIPGWKSAWCGERMVKGERWFGGKGEKEWRKRDSHLWSCCAASWLHLISLDAVQILSGLTHNKGVCVCVHIHCVWPCGTLYGMYRKQVCMWLCVFSNLHLTSFNYQAVSRLAGTVCTQPSIQPPVDNSQHINLYLYHCPRVCVCFSVSVCSVFPLFFLLLQF